MNTSELLVAAMRWLGRRSELVASNVARADVPGERPRDFAQTFAESLKAPKAGGLRMASTSGAHLAGTAVRSNYRETPQKDVVTLNQNEIAIENEMMKLAEISAQDQLVSTMYRHNASMIRTVVGGR
jgi:flagellar basal-body rod protein FlgB